MVADNLFIGDVRDGLRQFIAADLRAQCVVTSPPYWGLRDYGTTGQIGLEATPAEYVSTIVDVFRLVRDVLADDGTLWLNLGDSYGGEKTAGRNDVSRMYNADGPAKQLIAVGAKQLIAVGAKQLVGIPWRVAFALQADGWYLRSDIIWSKPNPMPESVTDRPTKAHEYLFLMSKRERYYYDAEAIKIKSNRAGEICGTGPKSLSRGQALGANVAATGNAVDGGFAISPEMANRRTVWTIATEPYPEAHFATFPTALVEPCIMAGSRIGDTVLDPFMGSGTVAQVAQDLGRKWIGCELNPEYAGMVRDRTRQTAMDLAE